MDEKNIDEFIKEELKGVFDLVMGLQQYAFEKLTEDEVLDNYVTMTIKVYDKYAEYFPPEIAADFTKEYLRMLNSIKADYKK